MIFRLLTSARKVVRCL